MRIVDLFFTVNLSAFFFLKDFQCGISTGIFFTYKYKPTTTGSNCVWNCVYIHFFNRSRSVSFNSFSLLARLRLASRNTLLGPHLVVFFNKELCTVIHFPLL